MSRRILHPPDRAPRSSAPGRSATLVWRTLGVFVAASAAQFWVVADVAEPGRTVLLAVTIAIEYALLAWCATSCSASGR